jgi:hypothetical protein
VIIHSSELTPEEEEEIIRKIAEKIHEYKMDFPGILFLETAKPLTFFGAQMGRFFFSPFLMSLGSTLGMRGEKVLRVFEKVDNVEKIISILEEINEEEDRRKNEEKTKKEKTSEKKGWRRLIPW